MPPINDETLLEDDSQVKQMAPQKLWRRAAEKINKKQKIKQTNKKFKKINLRDLAMFFLENNDKFTQNSAYSKNTRSLVNRTFVYVQKNLFRSCKIINAEGKKISIKIF